MNSALRPALFALLAAIPLQMNTALAASDAPRQSPGAPATGMTQAEAHKRLEQLCTDANLATRQGQENCIREIYSQVDAFSSKHASAMLDIAYDLRKKNGQWAGASTDKDGRYSYGWTGDPEGKKEADAKDYAASTSIPQTCYNNLGLVILDPASAMKYEVSTVIGLPRHCVARTLELAKTHDKPADEQEAQRLLTFIGTLESYLTKNGIAPRTTYDPAIPGLPI